MFEHWSVAALVELLYGLFDRFGLASAVFQWLVLTLSVLNRDLACSPFSTDLIDIHARVVFVLHRQNLVTLSLLDDLMLHDWLVLCVVMDIVLHHLGWLLGVLSQHHEILGCHPLSLLCT